jgi:hypothetical protein
MDIIIPSSLLRRLRLRHDFIVSVPKDDNLFFRIFNQNVAMAHEIWSRDALATFDFYHHSSVIITGSVSEAVSFTINYRYI